MNIISNIKSSIVPAIQQTDYIVGSDLLANLHKITNIVKYNFSQYLLLSDETVFKFYGKKVLASLKKLEKEIVISLIPPGESSKNFSLLPQIIKPFFQKGFSKNSCLISLGGGVVTDIGGFLASILLRGIANINIPTTLLGQVDAAIGGKSGVDFWISHNLMYKNMIGVINQPSLVISDVETLKTLPEKEILNGLGEMAKYWISCGEPKPEQLSMIQKTIKTHREWTKHSPGVEELVKTISLYQQIKINIVQQDPFDTLGIREKLNLGHTVGHAVEGASNGLLSHGESVGIGLVAAAKISLLMNLLKEKTYQQVISVIENLGLPIKIPQELGPLKRSDLIKGIKMDKKGGTFVLIKNIGTLETGISVGKTIINKALETIL